MTRLFYSDPLAAAYMAKHHGMKFQNQNNGAEITGQDIVEHAATGNTCRINIHPDSLSLLEPLVGDCIEFPAAVPDQRFATVRDNEMDMTKLHRSFARYKLSIGEARIIQRSGLAFMWPEQEAV